jgi:hypothetical protein
MKNGFAWLIVDVSGSKPPLKVGVHTLCFASDMNRLLNIVYSTSTVFGQASTVLSSQEKSGNLSYFCPRSEVQTHNISRLSPSLTPNSHGSILTIQSLLHRHTSLSETNDTFTTYVKFHVVTTVFSYILQYFP